MNKKDFVKKIRKKMENLSDYSFDEEKLLICMSLGISFEELFLKEDLDSQETQRINYYLKKRLQGEPLNKIFHKQNFCGYDFYVNKNVLAPRLETELLVETCQNIIKKHQKTYNVLDLCAGSGCVGLSILKKNKNVRLTLSDISSKALYVARKNAKRLETTPQFMKRDMLKGNKNAYDIIVCNPPYIKSDDILSLDKGVRDFDPYIALDGGKTGVVFYEYLAKNVRKNLEKEGYLILEIGFDQRKDVEKIFRNEGFETWCLKDFSNCDRIIVVREKGLKYA